MTSITTKIPHQFRLAIFSDFDGTVTQGDTVDFLLERLADPVWKDIESLWEEGMITSRECMSRQIPLIRGGWPAIELALAEVELDPDFKAFTRWCEERQFPLTIVSEGIDRVIHYLLRRDGISVSRVLANRLEVDSQGNLSLAFPYPRPDGSCGAGLCKCQTLNEESPIRVVIGDGASDLCWASQGDILFAKSKLLKYAQEKDIPYHPFLRFREIESLLAEVVVGEKRILRKKEILSPRPSILKRIQERKLTVVFESKQPADSTAEDTASPPKIGVLLLHGLTGMPSEMKPMEKYLKKQGYQVEVPLLRGHGATHHELLATTWEDWLAGASEALEQLAFQCDQVYVGGLSMSALLTVMLAAKHPKIVKGIFAMSPTMGIYGNNTPITRYLLPLGYALPALGKYFYWTEKPPYGLKDERLQRMITKSIEASRKGESDKYGLFRTYVGSLRQNYLLKNRIKQVAHQVKCPAMVVHSLEDTIMAVENATLLYSLLGSPDKQLKLITGCDHVMTVDLRKEDVAGFFHAFIERAAKHSIKSPDTDLFPSRREIAS